MASPKTWVQARRTRLVGPLRKCLPARKVQPSAQHQAHPGILCPWGLCVAGSGLGPLAWPSWGAGTPEQRRVHSAGRAGPGPTPQRHPPILGLQLALRAGRVSGSQAHPRLPRSLGPRIGCSRHRAGPRASAVPGQTGMVFPLCSVEVADRAGRRPGDWLRGLGLHRRHSEAGAGLTESPQGVAWPQEPSPLNRLHPPCLGATPPGPVIWAPHLQPSHWLYGKGWTGDSHTCV